MSTPHKITFGVELEFCVALIFDGFPDFDPSETKKVRFGPITGEPDHRSKYEGRVKTAIGETIAEARKYRIELEKLAQGNVQNWEVTIDTSIEGHPEPQYDSDDVDEEEDQPFDPYDYQGIEVRSPKLDFTSESLAEVESLCTLLTSTYKIKNNITTGLHVHLGHDKLGFTFPNLQKLLVFLYTFEPQINNLHPLHRLNHKYGLSMRDCCNFARDFQAKYGLRPSAAEFSSKIFSLQKRKFMFRLAMGGRGNKHNNYNFGGVLIGDLSRGERQTIEFRQHEGTMDGKGITHWVQVIIGFIKFVEDSSPESFFELLTNIWAAEKWEKMGDGKDDERAAELGPVLADHGFTIIDLLEYLGLHAQADYYKDKWHKHKADHNRQEALKSDVTWDFKQAGIDPSTNEYKQASILAELFTTLRLVKKAGKQAGSTEEYLSKIDSGLDEPQLWPNHSINHDHDSEEEPIYDSE